MLDAGLCPHSAATIENAERVMTDELQQEQAYLRQARNDADQLLDVLYNDSVLGKYVLKQKQDWTLAEGPVQRLNDHNELGCVVNICKNILFAAPPEGPDADLTEAELQREEVIRHHRLLYAMRKLHPLVFNDQTNPHTKHVLEQFHRDLTDELCRSHNAGISFPDPNILGRRRKPEMDSDAEDLLSELATLKRQKLAEAKNLITQRIKQDYRPPVETIAQPPAGPASPKIVPAPAPAVPAATAAALTATSPLTGAFADPAMVAMMNANPVFAAQMAMVAEQNLRKEEKKKRKKREKKEEEEKAAAAKAKVVAEKPPPAPEPVPKAEPPAPNIATPPAKFSFKEKAAPAKDSIRQKAPPAPPTALKTVEKKRDVPTEKAADKKNHTRGEGVKFEFPKLKKRAEPTEPEPKAATLGDPKADHKIASPGLLSSTAKTAEKKKSSGGLVRRMAKNAQQKKDDAKEKEASIANNAARRPLTRVTPKARDAKKVDKVTTQADSTESHPTQAPGRRTITPGEARPVLLREGPPDKPGAEKLEKVAEESRKAAKASSLKTSLKLLAPSANNHSLKRSGQITGSKPPSTMFP